MKYLDKQDTDFLKMHKPALKRIFAKRIVELRDSLTNPDLTDTEKLRKIEVIQEVTAWLKTVEIFTNKIEEEVETFV